MGADDFPVWFGLGSYGGLICTLLAACGIAGYALWRRHGSPLLIARAVLVCLFASVLMLAPIWWAENRLALYGPSLDDHEVLFWLCWTVIAGWLVPISMLLGYLLLAGPQTLAPVERMPVRPRAAAAPALTPLNDPARFREPAGPGIPWGRLVPLRRDDQDGADPISSGSGSESVSVEPIIALKRQMTVFGREMDCDIVVDDQRTSRHHAEIHWDHGRALVIDRGSMNGTLVNQQMVHGPTPLLTGDVLEIGMRRYRFEFLPAPEQPAADRPTEQMPAEIETLKVPNAQAAQMLIAGIGEPPPLLLKGLSVGIADNVWKLDQPVATIGRDKTLQIVIADESVSRRHAQIVRQQAGYFLSDLHSSNGTFLNDEALIAPALLAHGDILRFGAIELRCEQEMLLFQTQTTATIPLNGASSPAISATVPDGELASKTTTIAQTA